MQVEQPQEAARGKRKPLGGYVFIRAQALLAAFWSYREGHITLRQLRVWLALQEMQARRCELAPGRKMRFSLDELRKLVGGVGGEHLRADLRRLEKVGLAEAKPQGIEFLRTVEDLRIDDLSTLFELIESVENHRRTVPFPRRALRWLASASTRVLAATTLGHALRILYYRKGLVEPRGRCKASWVAERFGVDERGVRRARKQLVAIGLLTRAASDSPQEQAFENRWGRAFVWNLEWDRSETGAVASLDTGLPPLSQVSTTGLPCPESDKEPLTGTKNQKPERGPAGASSKKVQKRPSIHDVTLADLKDTDRVFTLFEQATERGMVPASDAGRLNFVAAAEHALAYGQKPEALFSHLVRRGLWKFITQDDEDAANARIKRAVHGATAPARAPVRYDVVTGERVTEDPRSCAEVVSGMLTHFARHLEVSHGA